MKRGVWLGASLLLVLVAGWFATAADAPAAKDNDKDQKESNRVRYSRTYVALAKLDLDIARNQNKRLPDTIPPAILLVLEENVALAEQWLAEDQAEVGGKQSNDVAVKIAEIRWKAAELDYKGLQDANRLSKLAPQRLERAKLKVELAQLNVAGAKELDASKPIDMLEFELERIREEVSELYVRQLKLLDRN
jgi:hypothetical protein